MFWAILYAIVGTAHAFSRIAKFGAWTRKHWHFSKEVRGIPILPFSGSPFGEALTEAAELPGLLLHDFRRSAVRNMIRRGVPQKTAMKVSGHKTDPIFSRYNIVSEADLRDAVRKIEQGAKAEIHSSFTVAQGC